MLPKNITCAFKNITSFIKLERKYECSYYLDARKKNGDIISNLIRWNQSDKSITHKKLTSCSAQNSDQIYYTRKWGTF